MSLKPFLPIPLTSSRAVALLSSAAPGVEGRQRVLEQAGDGHRADAAGDRGDCISGRGGTVKIDVADEPPFRGAVGGRQSVDADIDDNRAGLDPVALDHFGAADRRDDNIGAANEIG